MDREQFTRLRASAMIGRISSVANLHARRWPAALLRALLPSACALCGGSAEAAVCAACQQHHAARGQARCPRCANPVAPQDAQLPCGACLARTPAFDATLAACDYAAPLDQLVLQLKFGARLALAPWFARMLVDALLERPGFVLPDVLCPVPLGSARLVERGFNQALEIARPLSRCLGIALHARLALRVRDTAAQSSVAPSERAANIRRAFVVAPDAVEFVRGRHIGLVDDVMTSGRTLDELAATFKRFGAARVSNLVFARTPPH
jgi:ComF family protein